MDMVISHESALSFLDACARKKSKPAYQIALAPYPGGLPYECACRKEDFARFSLSRFARPNKCIDVLVPDKTSVRRVKGFTHHSAGGVLPDGSLLDAGGNILVCSAPMLFVQLCQGKSLIECIKLGFFLCGTYSPEPTSPTGTVERYPLTTTDVLEKYVPKARRLRGSRNAFAALPWILEGSASPMETELALPFFLPTKLGGYGFDAPVMNYPIPLPEKGRRILKKKKVRIDVYWPDQRIGFEYDSKAGHGRLEQHGSDQAKALVLESMGIHIESVTKAQVDDPRQLGILANMLREYGVSYKLPS